MADLNQVEDVLMSHIYRYPICENIIRMNSSLMFEHETKFADGDRLLIVFRYDPKTGLAASKIFCGEELKDVTEEYRNHTIILSVMRVIEGEIEGFRAAE